MYPVLMQLLKMAIAVLDAQVVRIFSLNSVMLMQS